MVLCLIRYFSGHIVTLTRVNIDIRNKITLKHVVTFIHQLTPQLKWPPSEESLVSLFLQPFGGSNVQTRFVL